MVHRDSSWVHASRGTPRLTVYCAAMALTMGYSGCCRAPESRSDIVPSAAPPASAGLPTARGNPGPLFGSRTYAFFGGVLSFADSSVTPFSTHNRKDQELHDLLVERGVPRENMSLLLDQALTASAFRSELQRVAAAAPPDGTIIVYYDGHGARADYDGSTSFLAYDAGGDDGAVKVDEIAVTLVNYFRGARVLLMADCCFSGALRKAAESLQAAGIQALSLTSADASNSSTENWTFTQTVIDAIRGEPLMDRNGDGTIVLDELASEVADAMKYRERQRAGYARYGVPPDLQVAQVVGSRPDPVEAAADFAPGRYLEASDGVGWQPVRVIQTRGDQSVVRFYHYSDAVDVATPHAELRTVSFARYPVGANLRVVWNKKTWDARVLETDGDFHKITYPGWPSYWDEWVLSNRVVSAR